MKYLNMSTATFVAPDLTTFAGVDALGLVVTGQRVAPERAVLEWRVAEPDDWCGRCGPVRDWPVTRSRAAGSRALWVASRHAGRATASLPLPRMRTRMASEHGPGS